MSDYLLFDLNLCQSFVKAITCRGAGCRVQPDPVEGFVVTVSDHLSNEIEQEIEIAYEALMADQLVLLDSSEDDDTRTVIWVAATLADGTARVVRIPAVFACRLFEHFSIEEIHGLVSSVVQSAMPPIASKITHEISGEVVKFQLKKCATADGKQ